MTRTVADEQWTSIIGPERGWFNFDFPELWRYRDLILLFVRRDFVAMYKQTILGPLWFFLQPLFTTVIFTVVFGNIARIPTDGAPPFLFYLAGNVCWGYFSGCLIATSDTFSGNASIFGKVYFPRLAVPISIVISNLFKFLIQFALFGFFSAFYYAKGADVRPTLWIATLPLLLLQMGLLGLGCGILVSSMTTKYRDLTLLTGFGVQLWMYATPVVYPLSQVPERYQWVVALNPMTAVVEGFRGAFIGAGGCHVQVALTGAMVTLLILLAGLAMFSRVEKTFMDTV
jgi:lipopolysaccharide transport system permease protein